MVSFLALPRRPDASTQLACYTRYQSDAALAQYCDAHYGPDKFGVVNFSKQLVQLCATALEGKPQQSALDLGCAVGRTTFELAARFDQVTGIDYSSRFIEIANRIKQRGKLRYQLSEEGDLISEHEVFLNGLNLAATATKATFHQGDAQNLERHHRDYDLILAANLIDRLPNPGNFLTGIHHHLTVGGLLVIASPYDWLERYTMKKLWLGGRFRAGTPITSLEGLGKKLRRHFELVDEPREIEFVLRKTARTFNHGVSQVSLWRRIS